MISHEDKIQFLPWNISDCQNWNTRSALTAYDGPFGYFGKVFATLALSSLLIRESSNLGSKFSVLRSSKWYNQPFNESAVGASEPFPRIYRLFTAVPDFISIIFTKLASCWIDKIILNKFWSDRHCVRFFSIILFKVLCLIRGSEKHKISYLKLFLEIQTGQTATKHDK